MIETAVVIAIVFDLDFVGLLMLITWLAILFFSFRNAQNGYSFTF